jgi:hypothetical protein
MRLLLLIMLLRLLPLRQCQKRASVQLLQQSTLQQPLQLQCQTISSPKRACLHLLLHRQPPQQAAVPWSWRQLGQQMGMWALQQIHQRQWGHLCVVQQQRLARHHNKC